MPTLPQARIGLLAINDLAAKIEAVLRDTTRRVVQPLQVARAIAILRTKVDTDKALQTLIGYWNNGWSADLSYLRKLCELVASTTGPIVECGSGLSTIVTAALCRDQDRPIIALEHSVEWHARVQGFLRMWGLPGSVQHCPLKPFEDYDWYDVPTAALPDQIELVICDGPPGETRGGRAGALLQLVDRLAPGAKILLDDTNRDGEQQVIARWQELAPLTSEACAREKGWTVLTLQPRGVLSTGVADRGP